MSAMRPLADMAPDSDEALLVASELRDLSRGVGRRWVPQPGRSR